MHTVQLHTLFLAIHTAIGGTNKLKRINSSLAQVFPIIREVCIRKKISRTKSFCQLFFSFCASHFFSSFSFRR